MKSNYAIFDSAGTFVRFELIDPATLPPIPLAADGKPRAVPAGDAPTITSAQALTYSRDGWVTLERDAMIVATELAESMEREEARAIIEQLTAIVQDGVTTVAQASTAIKRVARGLRWQLRQSLRNN